MEKYGFYDRLTADFPSQINVDMTQVCNLKCIHCPYADFAKSKKNKKYMLNPSLNKKLVDEVAVAGKEKTQYIRYTGNGEPLIHKNCIEMLAYAAKNSNALVTLTTNGTLLSEKTIQALLDTGIYLIDISIDANASESYKKIRGGDFELVKNNVLNLIKIRNDRNSSSKIVTNFIEQPANHGEAEGFKDFWNANGIDYVIIRKLHSAGNCVEEIANKLSEEKTVRRPCLYPWERILLNAEGQLSFCPVDWTGNAILADFNESSVQETWTGSAIESVRSAHLDNSFENCKQCLNCPDWKLTNWPDEGRSYANMITDFSNINS